MQLIRVEKSSVYGDCLQRWKDAWRRIKLSAKLFFYVQHIDEETVLGAVSYEKDVDGFHAMNVGMLAMQGRSPLFVSCTPKGCIELLLRSHVPLKGKHAVVIGRSNIVGTPAALLLQVFAVMALLHWNVAHFYELAVYLLFRWGLQHIHQAHMEGLSWSLWCWESENPNLPGVAQLDTVGLTFWC